MGEAARKLAEIRSRPQEQREITLLELVAAIADVAHDDEEVVAAVADLINSGGITLVGNFRGADVQVG